MENKTTINDIAQAAGVAKSTVSRYLNGGSVSEKTRQKIDNIIETTNYTPNTFAQSLKLKNNHTVGVIVPRLDSHAQTEMLRGLDAENVNDTFLIVNTYQDSERELLEIRKMLTRNVRGLIILTANMTSEIKATLLDSNLPVVIQGQDEPEFNRVVMDDYNSGLMVGHYAKQFTPQAPLILTIPERQDWAIGHERFEGIISQLDSKNVTTVETDFTMESSKQVALALMQNHSFDFIIGATDRIAIGALQAGLATNQHAKYIGFGKSDLSTTVTPNLTSFEYDFFETGKQLYQLFNDVCEHPQQAIKKISIQGQLVERDSTK
ncbi:LacI family sucrose operon transcriptional repressor [Weissella uvarum]|uniref:LacI family DNA-binding transcriptional regulator n=1 Tax=Weissella uvarum TaxID=1479233 RepID=UPI001960F05A|nr:LacI family DNA-binding transcriptional regulator [Weissella uvarum]MBM7616719.1 LacI family sucrose operon transcriptional repressor [Weissella uvarum]MCM0594826.1 LacI family DNA-binding transcriptional regulator [Weissella uvarum]